MRWLGRLVLLVILWLLAWGEGTIGNVVSGVLVGAALLVAFPLTTRVDRFRLDLVAVAQLVGHVLVQLVSSNVQMTREILRRRPAVCPGVLAHRLRVPSEHVVTLMTSVIALSPGTMTIDVSDESDTIYVHFLFLYDEAAARRSLERLERLAARAINVQPEADSSSGAPPSSAPAPLDSPEAT
ncbi:MAG TPA: Na+/H+ antiporter subunit E [Acidimicrobiales bacterium]